MAIPEGRRVRKFGRGVLACSGAALLMTLTACSSGGGQAAPEPTASKEPSQNQSAAQINNPKNAAAVSVCKLLLSKSAAALGYKTQGETESATLDPDSSKSCVWRHPEDSSASVSLAVFNRRIADYYAHPETWPDFKRLTISGHPAVRANQADPMKSGDCNIYLATQKDQMVSSYVTLRGSKVGQKDPCQAAKRALEATVPTLPAAK